MKNSPASSVDTGLIHGWEEKWITEDEMVGLCHRPYGHEFEKAPGVGDGQGNMAYCSSRGCKELDMTEHITALTPNISGYLTYTNECTSHLFSQGQKVVIL